MYARLPQVGSPRRPKGPTVKTFVRITLITALCLTALFVGHSVLALGLTTVAPSHLEVLGAVLSGAETGFILSTLIAPTVGMLFAVKDHGLLRRRRRASSLA